MLYMNDSFSSADKIEEVMTPYQDGKTGAGAVVYFDHMTPYMDTSEDHTLFYGTTGSGKSRRGTIPLVRACKEAMQSIVVVDPKGEIYYHTGYCNQDLYDTYVFDFTNILSSPYSYNPLDWAYQLFKRKDFESKQLASELVDTLSLEIYPLPNNEDPFWILSARSIFCGCVDILFHIGKKEEINLASVYNIISEGDQRFKGSTILKEYIQMLSSSSNAAMLLRAYVDAPNETKSSMKAVFLEGLSQYVKNSGLKQFTCKKGFDITKLNPEKPTAIYICVPDEVKIYDTVAAMLFTQLSTYYLKCARKYPMQRLPIRVNLVLEELGNIGGAIPNLPQLLSAGRSRNIRIHMVLQSLRQLTDLYGESNALTILDNINTTVVYRLHHVPTMESIVKQSGEYLLQNDSMVIHRNLITVHDLVSFDVGQVFVMAFGNLQYITQLPDYSEMFDTSGFKSPKVYPMKKEKEIRIIAFKEYVESLHDKKIEKMLGKHDDQEINNPFRNPRFELPFNGPMASKKEALESSGVEKKSDLKPISMEDIDKVVEAIDREIGKLEQQSKKEKKEIKAYKQDSLYQGDGKTMIRRILKRWDRTKKKYSEEVVNAVKHISVEGVLKRIGMVEFYSVVTDVIETNTKKASCFQMENVLEWASGTTYCLANIFDYESISSAVQQYMKEHPEIEKLSFLQGINPERALSEYVYWWLTDIDMKILAERIKWDVHLVVRDIKAVKLAVKLDQITREQIVSIALMIE